ncbi:MAG: hypothetical protein ACHQ03_06930 [Candidatus Bathyarchaeia archaeon]
MLLRDAKGFASVKWKVGESSGGQTDSSSPDILIRRYPLLRECEYYAFTSPQRHLQDFIAA